MEPGVEEVNELCTGRIGWYDPPSWNAPPRRVSGDIPHYPPPFPRVAPKARLPFPKPSHFRFTHPLTSKVKQHVHLNTLPERFLLQFECRQTTRCFNFELLARPS